MNLEAFFSTKRQLQQLKYNTTVNVTSERYKYLLSPKHLQIMIKSLNTTQPKFTWYAKSITPT